ncbi:MAG: hypothetical protein ACK55I_33705, partial [bacterium]
QGELANRAGFSRSKVSVLEVARMSFPVATGLPIAHTLGCQLFLRRDPVDPQPSPGPADESFWGRPRPGPYGATGKRRSGDVSRTPHVNS